MITVKDAIAVSEAFMRKMLADTQPHLSDEAVEDLVETTILWGPLNGFKIQNWLRRLVSVCDYPNVAEDSQFFTLILEVVNGTLRTYVEKQRDGMRAMLDNPEFFARYGMTREFAQPEFVFERAEMAAKILSEIENDFTSEEMFLVELMRNGFGHIVLEGYTAELKKLKNGTFAIKPKRSKELLRLLAEGNFDLKSFRSAIFAKVQARRDELETLLRLTDELLKRFGEHEDPKFKFEF